MQIVLIKPNKLIKISFPEHLDMSFWIKDYDNQENDLIEIRQQGNSYVLFSNDNCYLEKDNDMVQSLPLIVNNFYMLVLPLNDGTKQKILLYFQDDNNNNFISYKILSDCELKIGSGNNQNIIINNEYISEEMAVIKFNNNEYILETKTNIPIYVNSHRCVKKYLESGDIIFIYGYTLILIGKYILINGEHSIQTEYLCKEELPKNNEEQLQETIEDDDAVLYNENDYYSRQPRFVTTLDEEELKIESPPGKQEPDDTPVLYTIGPMLTMTMSSAVSVSTSVINLSTGTTTFSKTLPSIIIALAMIASTILWPSLMKRYTKKKQKQKEIERQEKYSEYLAEKRNKIASIKENQYQVLTENFPSPLELENIILNRKRNLWSREREDEDFLNVRLGIGTIPVKLKLSYAIEDFTMIEDNLKEELQRVADTAKDIPDVPVTIDLAQRNKLVLIGKTNDRENMLKSIVLQLATYHTYNDLKLVFMVNDKVSDIWESFKNLPHTWSDIKDIRYYADNYEDMSKLSFLLEQVFTSRHNSNLEMENLNYRLFQPYYLIIIDNIKNKKNIEIVNKILNEDKNLGFGLIVLNDGISNLPSEITNFLTVNETESAIITNDLNKKNQQSFVFDNVDNIKLSLLCEKLANIPIKSLNNFNNFKKSIGFLEMYRVGKVEQLNILDRWKNNNPVNSLNVPIGIKSDGELFSLDLHEKFHGPHGLIAGMTGSGKSEFIITYILSMCLNFNPNEVSFVLIDYKGGGLTGAFENNVTGIKLPHLAGTITNLDKAEINRALSSIKSELKRRQELFNTVKQELNESTLDIYKYQQLYRDGFIKEPISHLFIVSDEFAELKSQQPEFMTELISTARIGRSLGVHLILATQKPSGIVDDQIWSNSKFKVCLKVQETSDSVDVIKCPDAVNLKQAGRFYLQVGYNDYFAMGQSAYAGTKYIPKDKIAKIVNRDISFINNIGDTTKSIETVKRIETSNLGEELPNVLKYIYDVSKSENLFARKLWLDKIPKIIFTSDIIKKYNFISKPFEIIAVVGEYDDPENQKQELLTIDFNDNGNTIIYGMIGNELMLSSIIYSLIITHSPEELNIYIIDFGTEMFSIFSGAPQVGDVIFVNDQEKMINLFNTLNNEIVKRKKLFSDYSGSYNQYIKNSGDTLPRIIIAINNYEILSENYEDLLDIIASMTRECEKYGISFIFTVSGANGVRGKISQNFSNLLCLQFNDSSDYSAVLGPTHGLIPTACDGRGLVKIYDKIYEFQTAYPYKWDEINLYIKSVCSKLQEKIKNKASKIAILPNHVRLSDIKNQIVNVSNTPIGITKDTLEVSTFNFEKNLISLISSQDSTMLDKFVPSLCQIFECMDNVDLYVIDSFDSIVRQELFKNYYNSKFELIVSKINELKDNPNSKINIFVIYGIEQFFNYFDRSMQQKIKNLFIDIKANKNIRIIIADSITRIKLYEYEDFYKASVDPMNAIWIGSGITDQFTIKTSTYSRETRAQIPVDFGYNVNRGIAVKIKVVDFYTKD